jgi:thioredoxin reductase
VKTPRTPEDARQVVDLGAVVTSRALATNVPNVFAAGDVARANVTPIREGALRPQPRQRPWTGTDEEFVKRQS